MIAIKGTTFQQAGWTFRGYENTKGFVVVYILAMVDNICNFVHGCSVC